MSNANPLSYEHAEMLSTQWRSGDQFRAHGVPFREGPFSAEETEHMQDAIKRYQAAADLEQEDIEDIVLGAIKREGFWETITRGVSGRRLASIRAHTKRVYEPYRDKGNWTADEDARLLSYVEENVGWVKISDGMRRPASACRNRYQRHLVHRDTQRKGAWSPDEEARLVQVMQDLTERDRKPSNTSKFWKEVSRLLGGTRTGDQIRSKWCDSMSPEAKNTRRARWRKADSKTLINRVASLNLDTEDDVPWGELIGEGWDTWTPEKLRERWAALKATVSASATHRDVVERLMRQFSIARPSPS